MTELARVLFGREDIHRRVDELGRTITGDYVGREPVLISVLKGGTVFLADLMRQIHLPLETHLMAVSPYGAAEESMGRVRILLDIDVDLTDRDVLLVEDIVDTGLTLRRLLALLTERQPKSLAICALLDKQLAPEPRPELRFVGFKAPPAFLVGYGLDHAEDFRHLPFIADLM